MQTQRRGLPSSLAPMTGSPLANGHTPTSLRQRNASKSRANGEPAKAQVGKPRDFCTRWELPRKILHGSIGTYPLPPTLGVRSTHHWPMIGLGRFCHLGSIFSATTSDGHHYFVIVWCIDYRVSGRRYKTAQRRF